MVLCFTYVLLLTSTLTLISRMAEQLPVKNISEVKECEICCQFSTPVAVISKDSNISEN